MAVVLPHMASQPVGGYKILKNVAYRLKYNVKCMFCSSCSHCFPSIHPFFFYITPDTSLGLLQLHIHFLKQ
jgi:hypothetical protein